MTYRGSGKQNSPEMDAMALYNARVGGYKARERKEDKEYRREELFKANAPKNPVRRFTYNVQKRRMAK